MRYGEIRGGAELAGRARKSPLSVHPGFDIEVQSCLMWDPFAILELDRRFDLTAAEIERAYLARAVGLHPDTDAAHDEACAADLNRARQDLKDPETRGNILLALLGGPAKETDRSLPNGFLMQMMEIRGEMESGTDQHKWSAWGEDQRAQHEREVGALFEKVVARDPDGAMLKAIRTRLNAWRYIERMLEG